jgi:hypothetical protein
MMSFITANERGQRKRTLFNINIIYLELLCHLQGSSLLLQPLTPCFLRYCCRKVTEIVMGGIQSLNGIFSLVQKHLN